MLEENAFFETDVVVKTVADLAKELQKILVLLQSLLERQDILTEPGVLRINALQISLVRRIVLGIEWQKHRLLLLQVGTDIAPPGTQEAGAELL